MRWLTDRNKITVNEARSWVRTYQAALFPVAHVAVDALSLASVLAIGYATGDAWGMITALMIWTAGWFAGKAVGYVDGYRQGAVAFREKVLDCLNIEERKCVDAASLSGDSR